MFDFFFRNASARASKSTPPETKAAPLVALQLVPSARLGARDYPSLAREAILANAVAYRCVRMIAEGCASVPWRLYDGATELAEHPLLALLAAPNRQEDGTSFFERWYSFLQSAGNAYLQAATSGNEILALYNLRPDRVSVVPGANGWPAAYDYTVDNRTTRIVRDSSGFTPILHTTLFHPLDDYYGLSPIAAAANAIEIHNGGSNWTKALLDNAARPSGALVYKGPDGAPGLSDEQFGRLKRELEDAYQGSAGAGRPMVLEGGLDWKAMSYSPADLDFASSRNLAAREIALAFGVPPLLMGIPGDNTFANYKEANLTFWRQTVLPLVARTASALTRWLGPSFGETLRLSYNADAVVALAEERETLWDKLNGANFLTLNEKRAAAGYGPVAGGDVMP